MIKLKEQVLDGIEYYPKKSKINFKLKVWLPIFGVLAMGVYFGSQDSPTTSKIDDNQTLIIIKKAEKPTKPTTNIIIKSNQNYQPDVNSPIKNNKRLDEIIQTFEQQ